MFFSVSNLEASQSIRRVGEWEKPPDVVLCDASIVTEEKLTSVIRWWEDLGYEFGSTTVNPGHRGCSGNVGGTITITLSKLGAHTRFLEKNEKLHWAKVKTMADSPTLILAHEIGHALGWTHTREKGHIMNGRYNDAGWFSAGLRIGYLKSFPGARAPRRGGPIRGAYR
jgi:hypothetical protein